jgi:chromatin structure-remodeling complex subunit RSC1/2
MEVFHLSDTANAAIPADIREQFHCDDHGRVLFFATPPLDLVPPAEKRLGHSLKYLAAKAAKEERLRVIEREKRKVAEDDADIEQSAKRPRTDEQIALAAKVENLTEKALDLLANQVAAGTDGFYKAVYGERAEEAKMADRKKREWRVLADKLSERKAAQIAAFSKDLSSDSLDLKRGGVYLEDSN